jgi:hypothetical protein
VRGGQTLGVPQHDFESSQTVCVAIAELQNKLGNIIAKQMLAIHCRSAAGTTIKPVFFTLATTPDWRLPPRAH